LFLYYLPFFCDTHTQIKVEKITVNKNSIKIEITKNVNGFFGDSLFEKDDFDLRIYNYNRTQMFIQELGNSNSFFISQIVIIFIQEEKDLNKINFSLII